MTATFGELLHALRLRAGLSQNRLARLAGIDPAYVYRLERAGGARTGLPSRVVVLRLWAALEAPSADREQLLVLAGHCPEAILLAGGWDPFVRTIRGQVVDGLTAILERMDSMLTTP